MEVAEIMNYENI